MIEAKKPLHRLIKPLLVLSIVLFTLHHITRCSNGHAFWISRNQAVKNLENVIPLLEEQRLTSYLNMGWCKNIQYKKGGFSNNLESDSCSLFDKKTLLMQGEAKTDFAKVRTALNRTHVDVISIDANYDQGSSKVIYARFDLNIPFDPTYYIYQPNYDINNLVDITHEMTVTPINQNWYQINDDWN